MFKKLFILFFSATFAAAAFADALKIACVGDSITFGDRVENRELNNYPRQLQNMLGSNFEVRGFGVCGAALAKGSGYPYWTVKAYKDSMEFNPAVVVIKLGTNDSNPKNWQKSFPTFETDLNALIDSYLSLSSKPKVYLCLPVKCFGNKYANEDSLIIIRKIINKVAKQRGISVIDLYTPLANRNDLFKDNLHPNAEGAKIIAQTVFDFLKSNDSTIAQKLKK